MQWFLVISTLLLIVGSKAWADCIVDVTQEVATETVPYYVVYDDDIVSRLAVYTVKVYIKRCEIGDAEGDNDRFCTWIHKVFVERSVYTQVRGTSDPVPLPEKAKRIAISSTYHWPTRRIRTDGSEKNCNSQKRIAEQIDEQKRQLAKRSLAEVISADREEIEADESVEGSFRRIDW